MPDEKSKIRKCSTCGEWTPAGKAGCVHCDRASGKAPPNNDAAKGCAGLLAALVLGAGLIVSQCKGPAKTDTPVETSAAPTPTSNDDPIAILSAAEINLKANLKDPESAKFRGLFVSKLDSGAYALCGKVNSKNSFGGYTGFVRFIASVNPDAPTIIEGNPTGYGQAVDKKIFPAAYAKFCSNVVRRFDAITR